jgi:hypothetical protein
MNTQQFLKLINMSEAEIDDKRKCEIEAYRAAGVSTWEEEKEYVQIVRRQVQRKLDGENK